MKRIAAILATLLFAVSAQAKILVIVPQNTLTSIIPEQAEYLNSEWARWQKVLGVECETYPSNYLKVKTGSALYTHHGVAGKDSLDLWDIASQGGYSCAIIVNMPDVGAYGYAHDASSECVTYGLGTASSNLSQWINRNSASHAFPIPLIIPLPTYLDTLGVYKGAYTGQSYMLTRSWASTHDRGVKDAQGDSIYIGTNPTTYNESIVATTDSLSWVYPLLWRDDDAVFDALHCKPAHAWMTVGTGNHKVVWIPYASENFKAFLWPTVIGMFEPITPIDMPIIAELFGASNADVWGTSQDTTSLGVNWKAIKEYAVANGMKLDLMGMTWSMKRETAADAHPVFQTQAYADAVAYPNNIRITAGGYESWHSSTHYDWFGSVTAATAWYAGVLNRMQFSQDSLAAFFPAISRTRIMAHGGLFSKATSLDKADSIMVALAAKGITDVYNLGDAYGVAPPVYAGYQLIGAQRTWVGRGVGKKELRLHPYTYWRYTLQQNNDAGGDTLRISYINTAQYKDNRADFMKLLVPATCGYFRTGGTQNYLSSADYRINLATTSQLATHGAGYYPGMNLNALTFTGGSWAGATSTRSLFLDVMKMINNQVKMANYIQATYGTIEQPIFVYSWMEDVKHDRRNGRTYSNNHVSK